MQKVAIAVFSTVVALSTGFFLFENTAMAISNNLFSVENDHLTIYTDISQQCGDFTGLYIWQTATTSSTSIDDYSLFTAAGCGYPRPPEETIESFLDSLAANYSTTTDSIIFDLNSAPFNSKTAGQSFWLELTHTSGVLGNGFENWYPITFDGTKWVGGNFFGSSVITSFTFSTSTAMATVSGYWEATTTPYITQRLSFWQFSDTLGKESLTVITATTTGAFNYSFEFKDPFVFTTGSTTPVYSSFTLNASLDQYDETKYSFGGLNAGYITNIDATSTTISTSLYNASDFTQTPRDLALYPEYDCSISSITGCFKNAIIWAFYPTQSTIDNYNNFVALIKTKPPVGYFYAVQGNLNNLSATSTGKFSLVIPDAIRIYIFNPVDAAIAGLIWFFFITHFYHRLKHITI